MEDSQRKWTRETCYALAKQCNKKSEMQFKSSQAYRLALKNGWMTDYTWFLSTEELRHQKRPTRVKWSYERCRGLALQFKTLAEFEKAYLTAYTVAKRHGWMDDFDWLERKGNIYSSKRDNVYAYFFNGLNAVYVGRTISPSERDNSHHTNENSAVFRFASENDVDVPNMTVLESGLTIAEGLDKEDYYVKKYRDEGWNVLNKAKTGRRSGSLGGLNNGKWDYKACHDEAEKCGTLKEFREKYPTAYNVSLKNGWLGEYAWLERIGHEPNYWTYERCYEEAQKYKSRHQFQNENGSAYLKALKEKWIDDYVWFSPSPTALKWSYDKCREEAMKYTRLSDYVKNSGHAYFVARQKGWMKDFTWLDKKDISQKEVLQFSLEGELIAKYKGVREACRINGYKSNSGISQCCNGKLNQHHGFVWKYISEN